MLYIANNEPEDIVQMLKRRNLAVEVKHIESGDYVFGDVAIERKTVSDLISSVTAENRHLWKQLETMQNTYKQPILLIEDWNGVDEEDRLTVGIVTTILLFWKYQIIFSKDKYETVEWIEKLFIKYGVGKTGRIPPAAVIRKNTPKEIKWCMLQTIPHIGPVMANKILEAIPNIISCSYQDTIAIKGKLDKIKGLNKESKELLLKVLSE